MKSGENVVVSVTSFRTESDAFNVIPQHVRLKGTVRTLEAGMRVMAEERLKAIAEHTAAAFGAVAKVHWHKGYPVMVKEVGHGIGAAAAALVARRRAANRNDDDANAA